jgi:hypothetical protein
MIQWVASDSIKIYKWTALQLQCDCSIAEIVIKLFIVLIKNTTCMTSFVINGNGGLTSNRGMTIELLIITIVIMINTRQLSV